jgi:2,3-bisphosphoglycerate-independent phosphoglycerate mutase
MSKLKVRWLTLALGSAALAGFVAYPLTSRTALAEEHHNPRIHAAIESLHHARKELEEAGHDYHGKKVAAIEAIDRAIERLEEIKEW